MLSLLSLATLALATLTAAAPAPGGPASSARCAAAAANAKPDFPSGQTNLTVPSGQTVEMIAIGRGTQNYTCGSTGTWSLQGALATLYDITCLETVLPASQFATIPSYALKLPNPPTFSSGSSNPVIAQIGRLGQIRTARHYFVTQPAGATPTGNQPKFDLTTSNPADSTLYVTATKQAVLNSPTDATANVQWLQLPAIPNEGSFAKTVLRVDTAGGQPSTTTCSAGQSVDVNYAALYYFYH